MNRRIEKSDHVKKSRKSPEEEFNEFCDNLENQKNVIAMKKLFIPYDRIVRFENEKLGKGEFGICIVGEIDKKVIKSYTFEKILP